MTVLMSKDLGGVKIYMLRDGYVRTDGGAMHGVVPKKLWSRYVQPDEENMILMGLNVMLIEEDDVKILVDLGIGEGLSEKMVRIYGYHRREGDGLLNSLEELGLKPSHVRYIVLTHLHYDHAGGLMNWSTGELIFPDSTLIVQREEYNALMYPNMRTAPAYPRELAEMVAKLHDSGKVKLVEGDYQLTPRVKLVYTGGHTYGHQVVLVEGQSEKVAFLGDLVPMAQHVQPLWVSAFEVRPDQAVEVKAQLLRELKDAGYKLLLDHQVEGFYGELYVDERGKFRFKPIHIEVRS